MTKTKEVLTTGDVARICHVAPRTVSKWVDTGKLRGYRIPGSRDRRIPTSQLMQFMRAHGIPLEELEGGALRVLVVDPDAPAAGSVAERLARSPRYEVRTAVNDFQAGMRAGEFQPHVVLVDVLAPGIDAHELLRNLRANAALSATRVIAVAGALTTAQRDGLVRGGFDGALCRPYAFEDLLRCIEGPSNLAS